MVEKDTASRSTADSLNIDGSRVRRPSDDPEETFKVL